MGCGGCGTQRYEESVIGIVEYPVSTGFVRVAVDESTETANQPGNCEENAEHDCVEVTPCNVKVQQRVYIWNNTDKVVTVEFHHSQHGDSTRILNPGVAIELFLHVHCNKCPDHQLCKIDIFYTQLGVTERITGRLVECICKKCEFSTE